MKTLKRDLLQYGLSSAGLTLWIGSFFLYPFHLPLPLSTIFVYLFLAFLMGVMVFNLFRLHHSLMHFIALPLLVLHPVPSFIITFVLVVSFVREVTLWPRMPERGVHRAFQNALVYGITVFFALYIAPASLSFSRQMTQFSIILAFYGLARVVVQILTAEDFRGALYLGGIRFLELIILGPLIAFSTLLENHMGPRGPLWVLISITVIGVVVKVITEAERRRAETIHHALELKVIQEISTLSMEVSIGKDFFDRLYDLIKRITPLDSAAVIFWESFEPDPHLQIFTMGEVERDPYELRKIVDSLGLYERSPDMAEITNLTQRFWLHRNRKSRMIHPLKTRELYMGLIVLESKTRELERYHTQEIVTILSEHISISIQDYLLRQEMQTINQHLSAQTETFGKLLEISHHITSELDLDEVLNRIALAVKTALGFNTVLLSLYDGEKKVFERRAHAGLDDIWERVHAIAVPETEVTGFWVEENRLSKSYFVEHTRYQGSEYDILVKEGQGEWKPGMWHPLNMLFIPLKSGEKLIGYLSVDDPADGQVPTYDKIQAMEIFANQAVAAIVTARSYQKIHRLSIMDPLTSAFNHRHFQEILITEIKRHQRLKKPFTLAMIDLDNFKDVNDSFGHLAGDEVLKELVLIMRQTIRDPLDTIFRYGGEEFTIIFSQLAMENAIVVAERILKQVEAHEFKVFVEGEEHIIHITLSIGLAMYPKDAAEKDRLIDKADQALYRAKSLGKNRVITFSYSGESESQNRDSGEW